MANFFLEKGSKGTPVLWLQDALNKSAGFNLLRDGDFGNGTKTAVRQYQSDNGLFVDGQAGTRTFDALDLDFGSISKNGNISTVCWLLPSGGDGFATYNRDGNDQFGTEDTIARFLEYARIFNEQTGITIEVGNVSRYFGGRHHPHSTHRNGQQVDVRPIRGDGGTGSPLTYRSSAYSRAATQQFVDIVRADSPGVSILFNDSAINGARYWSGHDNHLHISFSRVAAKYRMTAERRAPSLAESPA